MTKRGSSIVLLILLFVSSVAFLLISNTAVRAQRGTMPGDEYLYQMDGTNYYMGNTSLLVYDDYSQSSMSIYKDYNYYLQLKSYVVTNRTGLNTEANFTETSYNKGNFDENWYYSYDGAWYLSYHYVDDYRHEPEYESGYYYTSTYNGVINTNISVDFTTYTSIGPVQYDGITTWQGKINGVYQSITVEVYRVVSNSVIVYSTTAYDFSYNVTSTYIRDITFYVDPNVGVILECDYNHTEIFEGSNNTYSTEFNSQVYYYSYQMSSFLETWTLKETTIGYFAVDDASIPGIYYTRFYNNTIIDNNTMILYEFGITDPNSTIDVELYVDGMKVNSWSAISSGRHLFTIDPTEIPFRGPWGHELNFVFYDTYHPRHNITWIVYLYDERIRPPEWSCWIEGPTSLTTYTGDYSFSLYYNIFADTNWTLNIYQVINDSLIFIETYVGYRNTTIVFFNSTDVPGDYYYYFELIDAGGYKDSLNLTVTIIEGTNNPPTIYGPSPDIDYLVGQSHVIEYELHDDDPTYYYLYVNQVLIQNEHYYDGMIVRIDLANYINITGTYNFTLVAYDASGHRTFYYVTVYAHEDITAPGVYSDIIMIYMSQGEDRTLDVHIYDENPGYIDLYRNNSLIETFNDWYDNDYFLSYSLKDLPTGTWIFDIQAFDAFGNNAGIKITVVVSAPANPTESTNSGTNTTNSTGENTLTIPAPGALVVLIALASISTTLLTLKRKK